MKGSNRIRDWEEEGRKAGVYSGFGDALKRHSQRLNIAMREACQGFFDVGNIGGEELYCCWTERLGEQNRLQW